MWLPDLYNRLALYSERHPDHTLTICDAVAALANSTALTDSFMLATGIDIQTSAEISNLTPSALTKLKFNDTAAVGAVSNHTEDTAIQNITTNLTLDATVGMTTEMLVRTNTSATTICNSTVNPAAFRNSLAIGLVCIVVYALGGYLVKFVNRKPLMSKLNTNLITQFLLHIQSNTSLSTIPAPGAHRGGSGSNPGLVMWDFVMDKSGAGAGFLRELRCALPIYILSASPQSSSLSPEAGTIGQEWPQCQ
jgi:hypothetical protein